MKNSSSLAAAAAAFLIFAGCGSSSSYNPNESNPTDITVLDGYITDGYVTDANGAEAVEDNVTAGLYHFAEPVVYPVRFTVGSGRIVDTNTTMDINMSAYDGDVISPITTIIGTDPYLVENLMQVLGDANADRLAQDYIENNDTNVSKLSQLCYAMIKDTNATQLFLQHIGSDFDAAADANITALIDNTIANDVYYYGTTYFLKALGSYGGSIADIEETLANRKTVIGTYTMLDKTELQALIADYTNATDEPLKARYAQNVILADISAVTDMSVLFKNNTTFNLDISGWNTSKVTTLASTFRNATSFNQPIGDWNTSKVTTLASTFQGATSFNQPIGDWNTSSLTTLAATFSGATSFNQSLDNWNTSKVQWMYEMFMGATDFNASIGNWDTSKVKWFYSMFKGATSFNQPIGNWNTVNGMWMYNMFQGATSFNQPLGNWNTVNGIWMYSMFQNATSFYQDLSGWNTSSAAYHNNFATGAAFETNTSLQPIWIY